jgi:hypothetical protein
VLKAVRKKKGQKDKNGETTWGDSTFFVFLLYLLQL